MKFAELIENHTWDEVAPVLCFYHSTVDENIQDYARLYQELRLLRPRATRMRIVIHEFTLDGNTYRDVTGRDGALWGDEEDHQEVLDGQDNASEVDWAIEGRDWTEWLGMKIDSQTLQNFSEQQIIAECLWEMTTYAMDEEGIQVFLEEIREMRDQTLM